MSDRACIAVGLIARGDRVLIVRESYGLKLWGLPGGLVEPGESISAALLREVREETGLEAAIDGLLALRERGDQVCFAFVLSAARGEAVTNDPDEIVALHWVGRDELSTGEYEVVDLSRHILGRWFAGQARVLPFEAWVGRDGKRANLYL